jgi:hypothetical protein
MKVFELTTGFITAVMIVIGTAFHVNNNATVVENTVAVDTTTVVEEVSARIAAIKQECVWYKYTGAEYGQPGYNSDILDFSKYERYSMSDPSAVPACDFGIKICAVCLPDTGNEQPEQDDLDLIAQDIIEGNTDSEVVKLEPFPVQ